MTERAELWEPDRALTDLDPDVHDVARWPDGSPVPEYPEPQPAHVRDGVHTRALAEIEVAHNAQQGPVVPGLCESVPGPVPGSRYDYLSERYQQERTARRAAQQDLEHARKILGQGPYVVVKLSDLNALTDAGKVEVRLAFGGGVTTDMVRAVLSLGDQAARDLGLQPQGGMRFGVDAHGGVRPSADCDWPAVRCIGHQEQPAEKPQEHLDSEGERCPCSDA